MDCFSQEKKNISVPEKQLVYIYIQTQYIHIKDSSNVVNKYIFLPKNPVNKYIQRKFTQNY